MRQNAYDNPDPPKRSEIKPGTAVWIIEKENYGSKNYKQGIVQDILSSVGNHPRGIKVRLTDGSVGRVQWLMQHE
ncbi:MAG: YwbE family protein [bacterium]|nr:YwbE family protein [bacterium]